MILLVLLLLYKLLLPASELDVHSSTHPLIHFSALLTVVAELFSTWDHMMMASGGVFFNHAPDFCGLSESVYQIAMLRT